MTAETFAATPLGLDLTRLYGWAITDYELIAAYVPALRAAGRDRRRQDAARSALLASFGAPKEQISRIEYYHGRPNWAAPSVGVDAKWTRLLYAAHLMADAAERRGR